ncbi:hypothetical protein GGX14DRAFT_386696 [Mycena pura]|uniref:Uncharacterized protein n=1 Tax=Mycena pura TaxID=153505 RepID=A0AAD6YQB7_9AGAR|nr:hypothetical protein GGX14DRAFT_386696 [Mycena pura]
MLDAFKIKPFDLEPVYAAWTTGPRFLGDPKKDPPVDDWLKEMKSGCIQHNVPQEYWHSCAQHFMGDKARARLNELKKVMAQMHGGRGLYRWNWKKFKVAMRNMSWDIDTSETETVKVHGGPFWWLPGKSSKGESKEEEALFVEEPEPIQSLSRTSTMASTNTVVTNGDSGRPSVGRSSTLSSFWPIRKNSKDATAPAADQLQVVQRPVPRQSKSDGVSTVHAPAWLLNAANALSFLQNEHPKVMSTLSAILIVAGSIPALPAISAGAGGAVLASSTAHAVGAIAVGIGSWIKTQQEVHAANAKS